MNYYHITPRGSATNDIYIGIRLKILNINLTKDCDITIFRVWKG